MPWKILLSCLLLSSLPITQAHAARELLEPDSSLNFVSIKKNRVAEVHGFERLSGRIDDDGAFRLIIDLSSVSTHIPIRDERMRKLLFQIDRYAAATISGRIDPATIANLRPGELLEQSIELNLDLHGQRKALKADVTIVALQHGLLVQSARPLILDAADFGLAEGIEKLREIAKLPSIATTVPVTFKLLFGNPCR